MTDEQDLLAVLLRHADAIYADDAALLRPAIAAYGELVRRGMGGEWRRTRWFPAGELVVARRGRPWTRRRVIYEVLDALSF